MNTSSIFSVLQTLEIPLWAKRPASQTNLFFSNPKIFSRVLVLLQKKVSNHEAAYTVFQGMLKVLDLPKEEICIAWCLQAGADLENTTELSHQKILETLYYWKPQNILIMGETLGENLKSPTCKYLSQGAYFVTHHPEALMKTPALKRSAYQVLLSVKESLENFDKHIMRGVA